MKDINKYDLNKLADDLVEWMKKENNIRLKDFAISNEFPAYKISKFAKQNKYFAEKLAIAKDIQESKLVKKVLDEKKPNPSFIKFVLKNESGWKDKVEENRKDDVPSIKFVLTEEKSKENAPVKEKKKQRGRKEKLKSNGQISIFNDDKQ